MKKDKLVNNKEQCDESEEIKKEEVFSDNYFNLWQQANLKVQNLKPYDTLRIQIVSILKEIKSIKALYLECDDLEDKLYLEKELNDLFIKLSELLEKDKEQICDNNIAFLTDKNGSCYFSDDTIELDKGIRKRAYDLLKKIKLENAKNFSKVPIDFFKVFQIFNNNIQILFLELDVGLYMVIGASVIGKKNTDIINRIINPVNKKYIEDIMTLIKNEEYKKEFLQNQATLVKENALVRSRVVDNH